MKTIISFLLVFSMISCNNKESTQKETTNTNSDFSVVYLENYFPRNDIEFTTPVKAMVISNREKFDSYFGIAQTMYNKVTPIDFEKNKVVAIITEPSDVKQEIIITETLLKDNKLLVKYKIEKGEIRSFTANDLKLFEIPKTIYGVDFTTEN
ncbi:hypothetical protein [Aequorivita sp. Q41]|uniref:hypothetical protein n=1 Tax=Aequorivita sp. Q41 TaxID=3153300 RepID=UPI003242EF5F